MEEYCSVSSSAGTPAPLIEPQSAWNVRRGRRTGHITVQKNTQIGQAARECNKIRISTIEVKQESLANAKVSARQPWYIGRNSLNRPPLRIAQQYERNLYIVEKYFQCATIPPLTMRSMRYGDLLAANGVFFIPLSYSASPLPMFPWDFRGQVKRQETRVMGLLVVKIA